MARLGQATSSDDECTGTLIDQLTLQAGQAAQPLGWGAVVQTTLRNKLDSVIVRESATTLSIALPQLLVYKLSEVRPTTPNLTSPGLFSSYLLTPILLAAPSLSLYPSAPLSLLVICSPPTRPCPDAHRPRRSPPPSRAHASSLDAHCRSATSAARPSAYYQPSAVRTSQARSSRKLSRPPSRPPSPR
jgi:hypothetical protein